MRRNQRGHSVGHPVVGGGSGASTGGDCEIERASADSSWMLSGSRRVIMAVPPLDELVSKCSTPSVNGARNPPADGQQNCPAMAKGTAQRRPVNRPGARWSSGFTPCPRGLGETDAVAGGEHDLDVVEQAIDRGVGDGLGLQLVEAGPVQVRRQRHRAPRVQVLADRGMLVCQGRGRGRGRRPPAGVKSMGTSSQARPLNDSIRGSPMGDPGWIDHSVRARRHQSRRTEAMISRPLSVLGNGLKVLLARARPG